MSSSEDEFGFEDQVEDLANEVARKVITTQYIKTAAILILYGGVTLARLILATVTVAIVSSPMLTIAAIILYPGRWALNEWLRRRKDPNRKKFKQYWAQRHDERSDEDFAVEERKLAKLRRERPYRKLRHWARLIWPAGTSILAGIAVGHLASGPWGVIAALVFFGWAAAGPFVFIWVWLRMHNLERFMRHGPRDTPEM